MTGHALRIQGPHPRIGRRHAAEWKTSYPEAVPIKVREVIRTLERAGWRHVRTSGDHRVFRNPAGRITVVSGKLGDDIRPGTYRAILRQTGMEDVHK